MQFEAKTFLDRNGRPFVLRNAEPEDAAALIAFLKTASAETPYLIREPEEVSLTEEQERRFLQSKLDDEKELMLIAVADGKHVGNCSLMRLGGFRRYRHRCEVAIALYQAECGRGIGRIMLETVLDLAKALGYEQAELEVIATNQRAIALYEKLGFQKYGVFPDNVKYQNGSYADAYWMMKKLQRIES